MCLGLEYGDASHRRSYLSTMQGEQANEQEGQLTSD